MADMPDEDYLMVVCMEAAVVIIVFVENKQSYDSAVVILFGMYIYNFTGGTFTRFPSTLM